MGPGPRSYVGSDVRVRSPPHRARDPFAPVGNHPLPTVLLSGKSGVESRESFTYNANPRLYGLAPYPNTDTLTLSPLSVWAESTAADTDPISLLL